MIVFTTNINRSCACVNGFAPTVPRATVGGSASVSSCCEHVPFHHRSSRSAAASDLTRDYLRANTSEYTIDGSDIRTSKSKSNTENAGRMNEIDLTQAETHTSKRKGAAQCPRGPKEQSS